MRLKYRIKRLERFSEGEMVVIPQADGTVKRFPTSALKEAFLTNVDCLRGETLAPHPLSVAIQNAADREEWHNKWHRIGPDY